MLLAGCSLPEAPGDLVWDAHLYIPLGVRTYQLLDLVKTDSVLQIEGSGIGMDDDSLLYFTAFTDMAFRLDTTLFFEPIVDTLIKPADMLDTTDWFELPDQNHKVYMGRISSGTVNIRVQNPESDLGDTARVILPNLIDRYGDSLVVAVFVPGHALIDTTLDLAGYRLRLEEATPQVAEARLNSTEPVLLIAAVQTSRIYFEYFDGVINDLALDSISSGASIEPMPEGWESIHPTQADLYLHLQQSFTATADLSVHTRTYYNQSVLRMIDRDITEIGLGSDTTVTIENVTGSLDTYPDSLSCGAQLTMYGRVQSYTNVEIPMIVELRAPLALTLEPINAPGEVVKVETSDLQDIQSGTARFRIWNRLPVGGHAYLVADHDSLDVLENSGAQVDTVANVWIPIPPIADGRAAEDVYTEFTIALDDTMLNLMRNPPFFTRTHLFLNGTDGDTLLAHASDYVKVQIIADVIYRMNTGDDE